MANEIYVLFALSNGRVALWFGFARAFVCAWIFLEGHPPHTNGVPREWLERLVVQGVAFRLVSVPIASMCNVFVKV